MFSSELTATSGIDDYGVAPVKQIRVALVLRNLDIAIL